MLNCTVLLALVIAAPADTKADDVKKVMAALDGYWDVTSIEQDGSAAGANLPYTKMVFTGDKLTVTRVEKPGVAKSPTEDNEARIKLDPATKGIEVKFLTGPDQDRTFYGVYELRGDGLKVCWSESKDKRPAAVSTTKGSGATLFILKRGKPGKP